jgi:hypothetical protein
MMSVCSGIELEETIKSPTMLRIADTWANRQACSYDRAPSSSSIWRHRKTVPDDTMTEEIGAIAAVMNGID